MPSIEFIIKANYKEVDKAIKKIEDLKKIISSMKDTDPGMEKLEAEYREAQETIKKMANEIASLTTKQIEQESITRKQTSGLSEQTRIYKDMSSVITSVLGSRDQIAQKIVEEVNALAQLKAQMKQVNEERKNEILSSSEASTQMSRLIVKEKEHKQTLSDLERTIKSQTKEFLVATTSITGMSQQLSQMRTIYNRLSEESRNSSFGKSLLSEIQALDQKLKQLDASIGNYQRNVGNYASGYNGLQNAMQQVIRETPSLAISLNTFFLAISNNLPILANEISRAIKELELLKAQGKAGIPVWRQVAKSLISWQTALVAAVSLLAIYGKDIADWITGLFGADQAQKKLTKSLQEFNAEVIKESTSVQILFEALKKTEDGTRGRAEAINKINAEYGKYLPNLLSEKSSLQDIETAYNDITESIKRNLAAKMQSQAIDEATEATIRKQVELNDSLGEKIKEAFYMKPGTGIGEVMNSITESIEESYKKGENSIKAAYDAISQIRDKYRVRDVLGLTDAGDLLKKYSLEIYKYYNTVQKIKNQYNPFLLDKEADKAIVENKKHFETMKKQAESVLNSIERKQKEALDAGKTEGIPKEVIVRYTEARKAINEATEALKVYDSYDKKEKENQKSQSRAQKEAERANKLKVQVANRIREAEEAQKKISEKEVEAELKIEQNKINAMEEGADKTLAQIQFNYQRQIAEVTKFGNELVKAQKDAEEKAWKAANPNWEKEGKIFEPTIKSISQLPQKELETLAKMLKSIEDLRDRQEQNFLESSLKKYQNYTTQRIKAEEEFDKDKAALEKQRTEQNGKEIDAALIQLEKDREKSIGKIKVDEIINSEDWTTLFNDMESLSTKKVNELIDTISDQLKNAKLDPINLKAVTDQLDKAKEYVIGVNPFAQLVKYIKEYDAASSDVEKKKALTKALKSALEGADQLSQVFRSLDGMLQEIGVDIPALSGLSNVLGSIASIDFTKPASIITGALGAIGSVFSIGKKVKEMNAAARAEQQKFYDEVHKGEMEYQALLRERARLEQQLGETSISYNSHITAELDKQRKTIDALVNTLMKQLQQESYISGVGYKHGTWFRKAKTWNEYESLMGKTYDEIEALYMSNKLDGKAKELFEELQKLKEEGAEIDQMLVDQAEAFREYLSGMTFDSLKESIKSAFEDGKFDIQDAADFTKQVFKKAILQALEAKVLEKALQPFLESFQSDTEAGTLFEPGKMDYYQEWIKRIGEEGNAFMDNLMKLPELSDLFKDAKDADEADATRSAQAKGLASMSQDTGEKLDGKFTAGLIYLDKMTTSSYDIAGSIKDLTRQSYDGWKNVEAIKELSSDIKNINNRIADNTEDIGAILKTIRSDTKGMNEDVSYVRTNGLYVKR